MNLYTGRSFQLFFIYVLNEKVCNTCCRKLRRDRWLLDRELKGTTKVKERMLIQRYNTTVPSILVRRFCGGLSVNVSASTGTLHEGRVVLPTSKIVCLVVVTDHANNSG